MILFFYGEDTFRLRQKLKALKEKFISSSLGETNLVILDGKTATFDEIMRQILAIPFLSRKRLVIIENILGTDKKSARGGSASGREIQEKVGQALKKVPESTVLVLVEEGVPDRRTALFRKLNLPKRAQEFKLLEGEALRRWIKKEVFERGGAIEPAAIGKLVEYLGSDLWRLNAELSKLIAYQKKVTSETIELLVCSQIEGNIFTLIEATAGRQSSRAIGELYKLFQTGASELYILTMIVYEYRNLLLVKDSQERSRKINLHPYVLAKTLPLVAKYQLAELKKIYPKLLKFETFIKTGKIEPRVALELLVFELTR